MTRRHRPYEPYRQLKIWILKIQDGGRPQFKKSAQFLYVIFMQTFKLLQQNLAGWHVGALWTQ